MHAFCRGVARYDGNCDKKTFSCLDQYLRMTFAQLTHRESLCDIEVCLRAQKDKFVPQGYPGQRFQKRRGRRERTLRLAYLADLAQALIRTALPLYADEDLGRDLDNVVYALDASTIDLHLSVFP